jgi:hypothetical protein
LPAAAAVIAGMPAVAALPPDPPLPLLAAAMLPPTAAGLPATAICCDAWLSVFVRVTGAAVPALPASLFVGLLGASLLQASTPVSSTNRAKGAAVMAPASHGLSLRSSLQIDRSLGRQAWWNECPFLPHRVRFRTGAEGE